MYGLVIKAHLNDEIILSHGGETCTMRIAFLDQFHVKLVFSTSTIRVLRKCLIGTERLKRDEPSRCEEVNLRFQRGDDVTNSDVGHQSRESADIVKFRNAASPVAPPSIHRVEGQHSKPIVVDRKIGY